MQPGGFGLKRLIDFFSLGRYINNSFSAFVVKSVSGGSVKSPRKDVRIENLHPKCRGFLIKECSVKG